METKAASMSTNDEIGWWLIDRYLFAYLFQFDWEDHWWKTKIPQEAQPMEYIRIVIKEHPQLLKQGIGNALPS